MKGQYAFPGIEYDDPCDGLVSDVRALQCGEAEVRTCHSLDSVPASEEEDGFRDSNPHSPLTRTVLSPAGLWSWSRVYPYGSGMHPAREQDSFSLWRSCRSLSALFGRGG